MKKIYLVFFICISAILYGQFQQTSGPTGGTFRSVTQVGDAIYGLTSSENLFKFDSGEWERLENPGYASEIFTFQDSLFSMGYDGVFSFDESTQTWSNEFPKHTSDYSVTDNSLFIVSDDTLYKSNNGSHFTRAFDSITVQVEFFGDTLNQQVVGISKVLKVDSIYIIAGFGSLTVESRGIFISHNLGEKWFPPEGLPEFLQVYSIVQFDNKIYISTNEGAYVSSDLGVTWEAINNGFTATDTNILLMNLVVQDNALYTIQSNPRELFRLTNGEWESIASLENTYRMSPYGANQLLLPNTDGLWLYDIFSDEFENLSANLIGSNSHVFALDDDTVLADAGNTKFVSIDGGTHWDTLDQTYRKILKHSDGLIYTDQSGIKFTNDLWNTTVNLNSNLSSNFLPSISAVAAVNETLYVGFNRTRPRTHLPSVWEAGGVYTSVNSGQSWSSLNAGLPSQGGVRVPIHNLFAHDDMLIAGTLEGTFRRRINETSWTHFEDGFNEYESPIRYGHLQDTIIVVTYYGIKYTTADMDRWEALTAGLDSVYNGYNYHMVNRGGHFYLYSNKEHTFFVLNDDEWQPTEFEQNARFQVANFSTTENYIYTAIVDGGVWKGDLSTSAIDNEIGSLPQRVELLQNYPNPFNPSTRIRYVLPEETTVSLSVYNLRGEIVATLVQDRQSAGAHSILWDGTDNFGNSVSSGVYFYRLKTGQEILYKKMMLLK